MFLLHGFSKLFGRWIGHDLVGYGIGPGGAVQSTDRALDCGRHPAVQRIYIQFVTLAAVALYFDFDHFARSVMRLSLSQGELKTNARLTMALPSENGQSKEPALKSAENFQAECLYKTDPVHLSKNIGNERNILLCQPAAGSFSATSAFLRKSYL